MNKFSLKFLNIFVNMNKKFEILLLIYLLFKFCVFVKMCISVIFV